MDPTSIQILGITPFFIVRSTLVDTCIAVIKILHLGEIRIERCTILTPQRILVT